MEYPEVRQSKTFMVTISPCKITSFEGIVVPSKLTFEIGSGV